MMVAFVKLGITAIVAAYLELTLFDNIGYLEALYEAINGLPISMLTGIMSTQLMKWGIDISQYFTYGGIDMLKLHNNSLMAESQSRVKNRIQGKAKAHSEWVR